MGLLEWTEWNVPPDVGFGDARKVTEARVNIDMRDRLIVASSGFSHPRQDDHKRNTGGVSPNGSLHQWVSLRVPSVITGVR